MMRLHKKNEDFIHLVNSEVTDANFVEILAEILIMKSIFY